jgi:hypothetical protein
MMFLRIRPIGRVLRDFDLHFLLQQVATKGVGVASSFFSDSTTYGFAASPSTSAFSAI